MGQQLGWLLIDYNVLEQPHFSRFSFRYEHIDAGEIGINVMMTGKILSILHIPVLRSNAQAYRMSGNLLCLKHARSLTMIIAPIAVLMMPTERAITRPLNPPALPGPLKKNPQII